jgi:hypothetical protein
MRTTILLFILAICHVSVGQNYFNKRIEYSFPGTFDWSKSIVEVDSGYIIGGGTGSETLFNWPRLGFLKISENGEKLFSNIFGDTIKRWWLGNPGSIINPIYALEI